ncbi:MAG TPA: hypothetical protein VIE17_04745 [Methylophilaceae bacterium]
MSTFIKIVVFLCTTFFAGCAQLTHGQAPEPAKVIDPAQNLMMAECNGYANEFDVCYRTAQQACPAGYTVVQWVQNYGSVSRQLIFKCK